MQQAVLKQASAQELLPSDGAFLATEESLNHAALATRKSHQSLGIYNNFLLPRTDFPYKVE